MRKKILIVEDNSELLALLRLSFRAAGFSIATATNGIDALKKVRSVSPDLILLDLILPELDGFAVCETLRRSPETAAIPVCILSGLNSEFTRLAGMESGATHYFAKPINPAELVSKVKEIMHERAPATRAHRPGKRHHVPKLVPAKLE